MLSAHRWLINSACAHLCVRIFLLLCELWIDWWAQTLSGSSLLTLVTSAFDWLSFDDISAPLKTRSSLAGHYCCTIKRDLLFYDNVLVMLLCFLTIIKMKTENIKILIIVIKLSFVSDNRKMSPTLEGMQNMILFSNERTNAKDPHLNSRAVSEIAAYSLVHCFLHQFTWRTEFRLWACCCHIFGACCLVIIWH